MQTILKLLGGYSQIIGRDIPPRVSAPLIVCMLYWAVAKAKKRPGGAGFHLKIFT